ncbi:acyl-CoA dehydrogenase [Mucilaginibacter sp. KACC 22063]|uniref:acyl-CoA dehydrogenase n=1 Tax=Mucilaginibacter sp. KACC 22063 TaxID=3025666 RepID=UPI0023654A64|nr:acyl-CoA dehydrogenase [Mucilaginibacter sp. KACC 22063]WDF55701.1 acyl-CoA dehydrogenase [Mucilaginibacter sp. KACC 22063]
MKKIQHPSALVQADWVDMIRKEAFAAEQEGQLQPGQLALIYDQQWFKLLVPKAYGGLETPLPDLVRLEEALAWADGSLGWVVTLCTGAGWFGGFIEPEVALKIFADPQVCLAGSGAASGTAVKTEDGYLINGSWKYASGVKHATHFTCNCNIEDENGPVLNEQGQPLVLPFVIDSKQATLIPAWKYIGMMGTGSHAFEIKDAVVTADRRFKIDATATQVDGLLYRYPFMQLAEATLAANIAGIATHFIDLCPAVFENKPRLTPEKAATLSTELETARWNMEQARSEFYRAVDQSWELLFNNADASESLQAVSRTSRQLATIARESVDTLYPYCGLLAASPDTEINQVWRDLHTASQHSLLTFN